MTMETRNQPLFRDQSLAVRPIVRGDVTVQPGTVVFPEIVDDDPTALYKAEKWAFEWALPSLGDQHSGRYVAIHRGVVVDSDASRADLVRRFFTRHGDTHVYIGYVGVPVPAAQQLTPFRF